MSVQIQKSSSEKVNILIDGSDVYKLISVLTSAKFGDEIKSYILLSPFLNDLLKSLVDFESSRTDGLVDWNRVLQDEDFSDSGSFAFKVKSILSEEFGEDLDPETLRLALYPNIVPD